MRWAGTRMSRLETYEMILRALVRKPLSIDSLAYRVGLDCVGLRKNLDFLIENGLVDEIRMEEGSYFIATQRGVSVSNALDSQKFFNKVQETLVAIDGAVRAIPGMLKRQEKPEKYPDEKS